MERFFEVHHCTDKEKVKLAIMEFTGFATTWWKKVKKNRQRAEVPQIKTWRELKKVMRKKYIHPTYKRDVLQKLQHLSQGSKSVDDYYKEMETLMEKADIDEMRRLPWHVS